MFSIILITDSLPAANGGGISQTLYNLLDSCKSDLFYVARPGEKLVPGPVVNARIVAYKFERNRSFSNWFVKHFNGFVKRRNFSRQQKLKYLPAGLPTSSEAWVLVSTTEPIKLHFGWMLQQQFGYRVIPYFMDDWMSGLGLKWKGNSIQFVVGDLLRKASCWLMISRQLEQTLIDRYQLVKKPCLVIHNPSPALAFEPQITHHTLQIVYAGSIWPMHLDALSAVAHAISLLNNKDKKSFNLVIYTSEAAWQQNRKFLEGTGVIYGGFIPYETVHSKMAEADLLLVTASFTAQYQPFSRSSVQTKLTDYIAIGKPVLYVGPSDGASGQFVHDWDCGYSISTPLPEDVAAQLEAITAMPEQSLRKATNGISAARGFFKKEHVQEKLYAFLEAHVQAKQAGEN